jgi:hypothetical protein
MHFSCFPAPDVPVISGDGPINAPVFVAAVNRIVGWEKDVSGKNAGGVLQ